MAACTACGQDNPDIARFCLACGSPLAARSADGRKLATLVFCDMSGSTAAGERIDPESVRAMMLRYFDAMQRVIERHGGTVEKFIGDAVMAVFGVPVAREDDALRAVRAAWDMQQRLGLLNADFAHDYGSTIALRIGVNTGEVVAGDVTTRQTVVTGDAVNVAARLEQAAAPGEVLFGETTYALVRGAVHAERVPPLAVKGKTVPVPAYRLVGLAAGPARPASERALVGREAELAALRDAYDAAVDARRSAIVTVLGDAGVGKSRLADAFLSGLATDATVLRGRCLSYGDGITFWPIAEIVRAAAGIRPEHSRADAVSRLEALAVGAPSGELVTRRVAEAIGLADGRAAPAETEWALRTLIVHLARARRLVVAIDDLHWGEPALLDLVRSLAGADAPLVVLCLARPELVDVRPDWPVTVALEQLDREAATALLAGVLGAPIAPDVRDRIVDAAGGNPLFLEELAAMLAEAGDVRRDGGRWVAAGDLDEITMPTSLSALLGARIDQLDEGAREAAERGAVEGQVFHARTVEALSEPQSVALVTARLTALARKGFVSEARAELLADLAYRFRHLLIRDAVYRATPKRLRGSLHERFADWLERRLGDRAAEVHEVLGYHLEQAFRYAGELGPIGDRERALAERAGAHLAAAGARASGRLDAPAATKLLRRAVDLLGPTDRRVPPALLDLAVTLERAGRFGEALEAVRAARQAAATTADVVTEHRAVLAQAWIDTWVDANAHTSEELLRTIEEARIVFLRAGDDRALAHAWRMEAEVYSMQSRGAECVAAAERAVMHARRAGDAFEEAESLMKVLVIGGLGPMPTDEAFTRCEGVLAGNPGRYLEAAATGVSGAMLAMQGDVEEGVRRMRRKRQLLEELGLHFYAVASVCSHDGYVQLLAGAWEAAEAEIRPAYEALRGMGDEGSASTGAGTLALAVVEQGRLDEAIDLSRASEELASSDDALSQTLWRRARARAWAAQGRLGDAEALARSAVAIAAGTDDLTLHGGALCDLATVLDAAGKSEEAAGQVDAAIALFERKGNRLSADRARLLSASLARAAG
jgi:class 3 adenylate cyclase/tetratricopeptide (TPR) repeat protein